MQAVTPDIPIPIDITAYDMQTGLTPALKVYDVTSGYPGTLVSTTAMTHIVNGTYGASFTPSDGKAYITNVSFYSDPGTWLMPLTAYSPSSQSFLTSLDVLSGRSV